MLHAFEQRTNAAPSLVGHRMVPYEGEGEFLVFGADAELRFRLDALRDPLDEFVPPLDRRQVDLITRHAGSRKNGRDLTRGARQRAIRPSYELRQQPCVFRERT